MNDTFSLQRLYGLFRWQLRRMDWTTFFIITLAMASLIYIRVRCYFPGLNEYSTLNPYFVFSIIVVTNFFRQLVNKESMAQFLILPSSVVEKFVFIAGGALFLPIIYFFGMMWIGDALGHSIYPIPSSYHVLSFSTGCYIFLLATATFFSFILGKNRWKWGAFALFGVLMLLTFMTPYFREHPMDAMIAEELSLYLPIAAVISSVVLLVVAFRLFNVNEFARVDNYRKG